MCVYYYCLHRPTLNSRLCLLVDAYLLCKNSIFQLESTYYASTTDSIFYKWTGTYFGFQISQLRWTYYLDGMLYLLISFFFKVPTMLCIDTGQDSIFYVFNEQWPTLIGLYKVHGQGTYSEVCIDNILYFQGTYSIFQLV